MTDKLEVEIAEFDDREPDTKPEADDIPAYIHADTKVQPEQDKRTFPLQLLRYSLGSKQKPSDVAETWDDAGIEAPPPGYDLWCNVYEGPQGVGYELVYEIDKGGQLYRKVINYGPEKNREADWSPVPDPIDPKL